MGNGIDDMLFMPPKQEESHMLRIEDTLQQDNLQQNNLLQNNPQQDNMYDKMQENLLQGVQQQDIKIRPEFFHPVNPEQEQYWKEQQAERQELKVQEEEKRWAEMLQKARQGESNPEFDKVGIKAVEKWLSDENKQARVEERAKQREYDALVEAQEILAWKIEVTRARTELEEEVKRYQPTEGALKIDAEKPAETKLRSRRVPFTGAQEAERVRVNDELTSNRTMHEDDARTYNDWDRGGKEYASHYAQYSGSRFREETPEERLEREEQEELEADRQKVLTPEQQQKADQLKAETAERLRQLKAMKQDDSELDFETIENRSAEQTARDKAAYDKEMQELVHQQLEQAKVEGEEQARQAKKRYTPEVTEEKAKLEKLLEETQKKYENTNKGLEQAKSLLSIHTVQVASGDMNSEENRQKKEHYEAAIERLSGQASQHEKAIDEYKQKIDTLPYYIEGEQQPEQKVKEQPKEQPKEAVGGAKLLAELTEKRKKVEAKLQERKGRYQHSEDTIARLESEVEQIKASAGGPSSGFAATAAKMINEHISEINLRIVNSNRYQREIAQLQAMKAKLNDSIDRIVLPMEEAEQPEQVEQVETVVVEQVAKQAEKQPEQILSPEAKLQADIAKLQALYATEAGRMQTEKEKAAEHQAEIEHLLNEKKEPGLTQNRLGDIEKELASARFGLQNAEGNLRFLQKTTDDYQQQLDKLQPKEQVKQVEAVVVEQQVEQQVEQEAKQEVKQPEQEVKEPVEAVAVEKLVEKQVEQPKEQVEQPKEQVEQPKEQVEQPKEQVEQPKEQVEQPKEQVKQIETVVVEKQDEKQDEKQAEKQPEQAKQIVISIQEQGLQNVNAVQKLVQNEVKLLTNEQKKIGLAQIISVNPADDAGVQKLVEQGLIQNTFLFHVLKNAFDDIDTLAADQMDLKSLGEQLYDGLSPDMYYYVDEYVAMKETKLAQPVNQEGPSDQVNQLSWLSRDINKDETAVEKTDEMSERELNKLAKSKLELRKLVDINTDYLSVQALPLAKAYLGASKKFSSAVVAKTMDNDTLVPEAEETWATLEHRYYGLAAQKRIEDMASAKAQRQKQYKQTAKAQRKIDEQVFQDTEENQELNFGYIPADLQDVLQDIHNIEKDGEIVGLNLVGDQDVLADIEAGTFEFDKANASKTREVKVTQGFADALGDIEAIEKTEETGLTEKEAVQLDSSQATLSPAYVQAAMRLDSWLQGDDGKNLMSEVPETRQAVLNKLVTQAFKYNLDGRMFGEKSFEKNGEKIIEMALFIPGLLELVNQEGKRSGYNASGKQPVLDAMGDVAYALYEGYSQYVQLHGLQLGDITRSQVKIDNVYEAKKAANNDADLLKSAEDAHVFVEAKEYISEDTLRDLAGVAIEHTQKSTQQHSVDAQTNVKIAATRDEYDHCLASMSKKEQLYRQQKENGTLEVVQQKHETVPQEQVKQAQQKVQEHVEGIQQRGGLQQEQIVNVYSQVEQEVRQEVNQAPQQPEQMLENRLDMATFDKKATAPLGAKELKEQERQRKKAIKRTGTGMGVTHRTGVLLESIEKSKLREIAPSGAGARKDKYRKHRRRAKKDLKHAKYSNRARWLEQEANEAEAQGASAWTVGITRMQSRWNRFLASKNVAGKTLAKVPGQMQVPVRRQSGGFDEIKDWTSAKQRNRLASLSPDQAGDKAAAQEVLSDAINTATSSLKLNAASFSASFFTANAQKIMEKRSGFRRLESLTNIYGLRDTRSGQKIRSYMQKFEALYDGFECFVANNGLSLSGESSFADQGYANMDEYRKAYKTQVTKNTNDLQRHYNEYCKALQGNA